MKLKYIFAMALAISSAMVNAEPEKQNSRLSVQEELNEKWAIPLINSYSAYRCGQEKLGDKIISRMISDASPELATSVITYGFMLSYGDHLSSISFDEQNEVSACKRLTQEMEPGVHKTTEVSTRLDSTQSLNRIFDKIGIVESIGERRANNLILSLHNIEKEIGPNTNISLLAQACGLSDPIQNPPNLLTLVNSSKMTGEIQHQDFIDITDAWVGYTQGLYWHAISLLGNADQKQKSEICSRISKISAGGEKQ